MFLFMCWPLPKPSVFAVSDAVAVIFELRVFLFFATFSSLLLIHGIFSQAVVIRVQYKCSRAHGGIVLEGKRGNAIHFC